MLDGETGAVMLHPDESTLRDFTSRRAKQQRKREQLELLATVEAVTKDGVSLRLAGNISSVKELNMALKYGAEGVGLFRTEFLYMDRSSFPTEDEQFEVYKLVAEKKSARRPLSSVRLISGGQAPGLLPAAGGAESVPRLPGNPDQSGPQGYVQNTDSGDSAGQPLR
ncbi:putative PEP-binding protein [Paenibacillus rhizoplanae]